MVDTATCFIAAQRKRAAYGKDAHYVDTYQVI